MVTAPPPTYSWTPNPRQREVMEWVRDIPEGEYGFGGYGGAAGGAKTNLLAEFAIEVSITCPGARTLIGRQVFKDLRTTTLEEFDNRCPPEIVYKRYDSGPVYRDIRLPDWPEGIFSRVYFREVKDAKNGIGSEQYGWVLLEEAHEIDKADILYLFSRLRHKPERKWGMICAFNPFPSFVVDCFIDGTDKLLNDELLKQMQIDPMIIHQNYVPARVSDNPHLPPNYHAMMAAAYSNDPFMLAVLLKGESGVVPNAIFPPMHDPEIARQLRVEGYGETHFTLTGEGVDWGTTVQHQSAIVCGSIAKDGLLCFRDAWMSPQGSSDELYDIGQQFKDHYSATFAVYDRSQGSLEDDLRTKSASYMTQYPDARKGLFADVRKGTRDVDGRIREFRGLLANKLVRFDWRKPGIRALWQQFAMYHRDDKGEVVEIKDDLVDAALYLVHELQQHGAPPLPTSYTAPGALRRANAGARMEVWLP